MLQPLTWEHRQTNKQTNKHKQQDTNKCTNKHTHTADVFEPANSAHHCTDLPPSFRLLVPAGSLHHWATGALVYLPLHSGETGKLEQEHCLLVTSNH